MTSVNHAFPLELVLAPEGFIPELSTQVPSEGDRALLERTLEELRDRGLYPYPLRWRRLVRREDLTKRAVDAASFLYPAAWYLRLWVRLRTRRT